MVQSIDLATLLAQLPNAQHIHHLVQTHPEIFQTLAGDITRRKAELRKRRLQKATPGDAAGTVRQEDTGASSPGKGTARARATDMEETLRGRILDTEV